MTDPRLERPRWRGRTNVDAFTIACVEHAESLGTHLFDVTQGSYQRGGGSSKSAGTHDLGGAVDLSWCGHDACVLHLRQAGGFFWHRTPDQGDWPHHIHGGPLSHPLQSATLAAQERAYRQGFNGLGHLGHGGPDDGPRVNPIPEPLWPWPQDWFEMATEQDLAQVVAAEIKKATPGIVKAILDARVDNDPVLSVRRALRVAAQED